MSAKTCRVIFNFPGKGVILTPPSIGANDSAHDASLRLKLSPGENTVPLAAAMYWLAPGRLRGVKSERVGDTFILSADEAPLTPESLKQRRAWLDRERLQLEKDQLSLDRQRFERTRRR